MPRAIYDKTLLSWGGETRISAARFPRSLNCKFLSVFLKEEENVVSRADLYEVLRPMDWLFPLSSRQGMTLRQDLAKLNPERIMPSVISFERFARQEGHEGGLEQGLEQGRERGRE